jgi:hypothetical protein
MTPRSLLCIVALGLFGCTGPTGEKAFSSGRGGELRAPSPAAFARVGNALQPRCGTLDCHGHIARNLRLYGARGLRRSASDSPAQGTTTIDESMASYDSIVGLEPDMMSAVVQDGASHPEWLSLVRKPLGIEKHKGGQLMTPGDALHRCVISWLGGALDAAACDEIAGAQRPGGLP